MRIEQLIRFSRLFSAVLVLGLALLLGACAGEAGPPGPEGPQGPIGPQGPQGPPGDPLTSADLTCVDCHNDTNLISGKHTAWSLSRHGSGETFLRGTSSTCAGCHSGSAFTGMIEAGLNPGSIEAGDPDPTRQDCRTCHQIHETYTAEDWALVTSEPVDLYAFEGVTFDGGEGNLCANCHQPRRGTDEAVNGQVEITSTHWGPHHGPQSAMLLGIAGAGDVDGSPSSHYNMIENTCTGCHMGEGASHTFEPSVSTCTACHAGVDNFDVNGAQSEILEMLDELEELLLAQGLLDEEGHPAIAAVPEDYAAALWNWIYIAHEDRSVGVHNPSYTLALLEFSLASLR